MALFLIALGLSMDAFSVSICKGLSLRKVHLKEMLIVGAWFGGFQALMPLIGYYVAQIFSSFISKYAPWISFILLMFIGGKMVIESFKSEEDDGSLSPQTMFILALATSIDALAVGVTLAALKEGILLAVCEIGIVTFVCCMIGIKIGSLFGDKYHSKATFLGGLILMLVGLKIVLQGGF